MTNAEYISYMRANPQEWGRKAKDRCTKAGATVAVLHNEHEINAVHYHKRAKVQACIASKLLQYRNPCIVVRHDKVG